MKMDYQINLSSGELYTLAGLLQFNCLYGIESDTMNQWQTDLQRHIYQTVKRLEDRKLIFFELYGKLLIEENIKTIIELMANPDNIAIVSGKARNGRTVTMYFFEREGIGVTVSILDEDNYKIVMNHSDEMVKLICGNYISATNDPIHERILVEDVKYIQSQITSFQTDTAKDRLSKCVTCKKNLDFIYKILEKNTDFTETRFLKRKKNFYETKFELLVSFDSDHSVTLAIDEHEVLSIDSLDKGTVDRSISEFFTQV